MLLGIYESENVVHHSFISASYSKMHSNDVGIKKKEVLVWELE